MARKLAGRLFFLVATIPAWAIPGTGGIAWAANDAPLGRRLGFAMYQYEWALYQTPDGKTECPNGFNLGPREQYKQLFPEDGTHRKLMDTQLAREAEIWWPKLAPEPYAYKEAQGKIGYGINLDGRIGPNDLTSPEGERGIDNQMSHAIGCTPIYRGPDGTSFHFTTKTLQERNYNRIIFELTDVDSLTNDDDVTLTTYRGREQLMGDATGAGFLPGGTQRIDTQWGKEFIHRTKGKIVDGVLITEPMTFILPATEAFEDTTVQVFKGVRLKLKITADKAEGLLAGYTDIEAFYLELNEAWSTHHQSYGQESAASLYRALYRLADGYPDPKTGRNTAISSALKVYFIQVFVDHGDADKDVAGDEPADHRAAQLATAGRAAP